MYYSLKSTVLVFVFCALIPVGSMAEDMKSCVSNCTTALNTCIDECQKPPHKPPFMTCYVKCTANADQKVFSFGACYMKCATTHSTM